MKCSMTLFLAVGLLLTAGGVTEADWNGASTIRDETFYVASTGLTLGAWTDDIWGGVPGYTITENFQINMEYQAGILDKDIANINTYLFPANAAFPDDHTDGTWSLNFSDPECYVFNVNTAGGLTLYEYDGLVETVGGTDIKWTLTGWHQTILAGDIVGNELVVVPAGTYRPFTDDPPVNNVEIFSGNLATEVLGYTFTGDACDIGSGSVLGVHNVPEPGTLVLLALGGLTALGAAWFRRRRAGR